MKCGLRGCDLVGSLTPGLRPLEGKSFYLDEVKSRPSGILTDVIGRLGGKVESFLHKDVSVVITGNREALSNGPLEPSPHDLGRVKIKAVGSPHLQKESVTTAQRPGTPRPPVWGSRGKALLEKAISNNDKTRGSVLTNARSWGVKIVGADDFLKFVDQLTVELSVHKSRRIEKKSNESSGGRVVKGVLKGDFLKVEDSSRKYRPLHSQSLSFPLLSYMGKFSPFEPPAPPRPRKRKEDEPSKDQLRKSEEPISSYDNKPSAPLPQSPSPRRPRKKSSGYCECCQISYKDQDEHLQSDLHRGFVEDIANYAVVDQLVADMDAGFSYRLNQHVDCTLIRSPCCSPVHLIPSMDIELQTKSETETAPQTLLNHGSDQLSTIMGTGNMNAEHGFGPVCESPLQPQEPGFNVPPLPSLEAKPVEDRVTILLISELEHEGPIPNLCPEDICCGSNSEPQPQNPSPVPCAPHKAGLDHPEANAANNLGEVNSACPNPLLNPGPSQQTRLDENDDFSAPSNSSKQRLGHCHGAETGGTLMVREHTPLASNINRMEICERQSFSCSVSSPTGKLSTRVNPRKRGRSFTLSPKSFKKMRLSQWSRRWSGPTDKNSVNATYLYTPFVCSEVLSVEERLEAKGTEACDSVEYEICEQDLPDPLSETQISTLTNIPEKSISVQQDRHGSSGTQDDQVTNQDPEGAPTLESNVNANGDKSSELGPPQLYPFYLDDIHQQQPPALNPPKLIPAVPFPSPPEQVSLPLVSQTSSASLLSQSFSSVCIESALVPDCTFSPTSSESDWDSGLMSNLAPAVHLQPRERSCELEVGLLLQRRCAGVQDGSYASQLYSVLQPTIPPPPDFADSLKLNSLCRPMETVDRRIIQSLGV
ncbi:uncharacterized protein dbf4b isoform X2 [Hoplias malabaricus]|uniref:uncharacterized protein dbf4b isoform X2 n=1 Tax=Hoplias malabaricus TaxID=27720 RepID=UPI003462BF8C